MLLHEPFAAVAARLPEKIAVVGKDERLTYGQLQQRVHALARVLRDDGVQPGDRVVVLLENDVSFAVALQAVLAVAAVFVPVSPLAKADKVTFIVDDTRAAALVTADTLAATWQPVLERARSLLACRVTGHLRAPPHDPRVRAWPHDASAPLPVPDPSGGDEDLALVVYTSGTTGVPKGVMLSHRNVASACAAIQDYLHLREQDVIGLALPAAFTYGLTNLLLGLAAGATIVFEPWAAFPVKVAETLVRERVTVLPGVPTLFASLLGLQSLRLFDLGALRLVTNAAAALPLVHLERLRELLPRAQIISMYGMTECIRASWLPPEETERRPDSVGQGLAQQAHWLVDSNGELVSPGAGTGELVVSGPHVMRGYWERPAETAQRLRRGPDGTVALHTGDLFRRDEGGWLYFVARKDDIIKTRGEKVAPREVENTIYQLPDVTGCAVVGVADVNLGQAVKAYVTLKPGCRLAERDIIRHCLARLENYMAPKLVEIVDELPRTESGKIRHASLR